VFMHDQKRSNLTSAHTKTFVSVPPSTDHLYPIWSQFYFYYSCGKMYIVFGLLFKHRPFEKQWILCHAGFKSSGCTFRMKLVSSAACWTLYNTNALRFLPSWLVMLHLLLSGCGLMSIIELHSRLSIHKKILAKWTLLSKFYVWYYIL